MPLYVTMANPSVVLCRAKVPQGVRASWEQSTAGQRTLGQPGGAACRSSLFTLGPQGKGWDAELQVFRQWLLRSSASGLLLSGTPHSLHTAAPNPKARTNGITVCLVPFWKRGREERRKGDGPRAPRANNFVPGSLLFTHLSCRAASQDSWASQVSQSTGTPKANRSCLEVSSIKREKHVPNPRSVWLLWSLSGKVAERNRRRPRNQQV